MVYFTYVDKVPLILLIVPIMSKKYIFRSSNSIFTITVEILARSLANFYRQYADRHMNLKFVRRVSERERALFHHLLS